MNADNTIKYMASIHLELRRDGNRHTPWRLYDQDGLIESCRTLKGVWNIVQCWAMEDLRQMAFTRDVIEACRNNKQKLKLMWRFNNGKRPKRASDRLPKFYKDISQKHRHFYALPDNWMEEYRQLVQPYPTSHGHVGHVVLKEHINLLMKNELNLPEFVPNLREMEIAEDTLQLRLSLVQQYLKQFEHAEIQCAQEQGNHHLITHHPKLVFSVGQTPTNVVDQATRRIYETIKHILETGQTVENGSDLC